MDKSNPIAKSVGELILMDVFAKHGISKDQRRELSEEQKQELRKIVQDLKKQTEAFLRQSPATRTIQVPPAEQGSIHPLESTPMPNDDKAGSVSGDAATNDASLYTSPTAQALKQVSTNQHHRQHHRPTVRKRLGFRKG